MQHGQNAGLHLSENAHPGANRISPRRGQRVAAKTKEWTSNSAASPPRRSLCGLLSRRGFAFRAGERAGPCRRKMASRYLHSPSAGPPLAAAFPACGQIFLGFSARTAPPCPAHYRCAVATLIFRGVSVAHIGDGAKRFKRLNFQRPPLEALWRRFAVKNAPFNPRQFTAHPHRTPSVALPCSKS